MKQLSGNLALLLAAAIWGFCFVAQSVGMDAVGPFTFQGVRCILGALVLTALSFGIDTVKKRRGTYQKPTKEEQKMLLKGGLFCGIALCVATNLQQVGLMYTTVAKSGFITSMYMVFVPIASILLRKRPTLKHWLCVALAVVGLYFLSITGGFSLNQGDFFTLLCAFTFTAHIMVIDHYAPHVDGVKLSCLQFWFTGIVSSVIMLLTETPSVEALRVAWLPIAYAGIMSCAGAYTLQIIGQKNAEPVVATLLMSLESVFSLVGGMLLLRQIPTAREAFGCALVFIAVVTAQIPIEKLFLPQKELI